MNKVTYSSIGVCALLALGYFVFVRGEKTQVPEITQPYATSEAHSQSQEKKPITPTQPLQTQPSLLPANKATAKPTKLLKSVDEELRDVKDLAAHLESLAANQAPNAKFTQARILQRCAQAAADSRALPTSFKPDVVPDSAPFAVRRNAIRLKAKEEQAALLRSCGALAKQPASDAQVTQAYRIARDLGDPRAVAYFELENYNSKLKFTKLEDPVYKAAGLGDTPIASGPDEARSKWLLSLLTSKDEEVRKLAGSYVPENFVDKALYFDNKPISAFEWLWAWQLSACDIGADCSSSGSYMEGKCRDDPDTCSVAHYAELYRAEIEGHNKTFPAGATDPARVEELRRALVAAISDGNTSRFTHVNQPFNPLTGIMFKDRWSPLKLR